MDLITYCPAIDEMRLTIANNPNPIFNVDEESEKITMIDGCHIPVKYHGNETLSVVRGHSPKTLENYGLEILGYVAGNEYTFKDEASKATYERVRNQQTRTDEDGNEYTESYKIGVIA